MKDLKAIIGSKVHYIRTVNHLSQEEFALKLNLAITRGHISKIENGLIVPSAEFIKVICTTFSISPYWLLDIKEPALQDPAPDNYHMLSPEAKKVINDLISILLSNT